MKIITEFVYPPIPSRSTDWCAYDDDLGCEPGAPVGWGATEAEAIAELHSRIEERL